MEIEKKIDDIFSRGVGQFIDPDGTFRKKLLAKAKGEYDKDIIIKYGVDPTRPDIHLGHAVCFRKLRQLQDLGCKVIFLVGDFTATIGDPTGKSKTRLEMEQKDVESNVQTYLDQIDFLLDTEERVFSWIRNSDWFYSPADIRGDVVKECGFIDEKGNKIPIKGDSLVSRSMAYIETRMQKISLHRDVIHSVSLQNALFVLRKITHSQLIERDMFQDRLNKGEPLFVHEMLYPVFQGLDSNVLHKIYGSCDLEVGGTDQTFNMLMGRDVMEMENISPQAVMTLNLLEGTDGKEKMSKSLDNYIGITEELNSMFGKVMSIPDTSIINYFELATEVPMEEIESIREAIDSNSMNPRDAKVRLAREIVALYHGAEEAAKAEEYFVNTFSKGEIPEDIPTTLASIVDPQADGAKKYETVVDLIVRMGFAKSKSDAWRKVEQGGVSIDGEKLAPEDIGITKDRYDGKVLKVGKKDFVKIVF